MYGNRTKHKILEYYFHVVNESEIKVPPPKIKLTEYAKSVKGVHEDKVAMLLMNMNLDGYFKFYPILNDQLIEITNKGLAAHISKNFIKTDNEIFWKGAMNISLTVANIIVAIAAVLALSQSKEKPQTKDDIKRLKEEWKQELQLHENSDSATPIPKNNNLTSIKDSSKTYFLNDTIKK